MRSIFRPDYNEKIGAYLIRSQLITPDQLDVALREQGRNYRLIGEILINLGYIEADTFYQALSVFLDITYINLEHSILDESLVRLMPLAIAQRYCAIILQKNENKLVVGLADPMHVITIDLIQYHLGFEKVLEFVLCQRNQIEQLIQKYYLSPNLLDITDDTQNYLQQLLLQSVNLGASDVHIRPDQQATVILLRRDGVLIQHQVLHLLQWQRLSAHIKVLAHLDIAEKRRPQDGRFDLSYPGRVVNCRVSVIPTVNGESIVIRLLDQKRVLIDMHQLGFSDEQQVLLQKILTSPQGLFIIAGPTGAGKTTTLYALLAYLQTTERNLVTIEEPVEYLMKGIRQMNIKPEILNFADALRSVLRHDPDIIYISEIRDQETAIMALRAAMTGHLVLATLHVSYTQQIPYRFLDFGISLTKQAGCYIGLMGQRLIRCICEKCRNKNQEKCDVCLGTGYDRRQVVAEIVAVDRNYNDLLSKQAGWDEFSQWFMQSGYLTMYQSALTLKACGKTTVSEISRVFGETYA